MVVSVIRENPVSHTKGNIVEKNEISKLGQLAPKKAEPVITDERVEAFTPILEHPQKAPTVPAKHQELIALFRTLEDHGLHVHGTGDKESLKDLLQRLGADDKYPNLTTAVYGEPTVVIDLAKDQAGGNASSVYMPLDKVKSLATELKTPGKFAVKDIEWLKDLEKKGAEFYLDLPGGYPRKTGNQVAVSPELFHWFMENPTYQRRLTGAEIGASVGAAAFVGMPAYALLTGSPLKTEKVISGGLMDATRDGAVSGPTIDASNWGEFKEKVEKLQSHIDIRVQKEALEEEQWQIYKGGS